MKKSNDRENDYERGDFGQLMYEFKRESKETFSAYGSAFVDFIRLKGMRHLWNTLNDHCRASLVMTLRDGKIPDTGKYRKLRGLNRRRVYFTRYFLRHLTYTRLKLMWEPEEWKVCDPKSVKSVLLLQHVNSIGDPLIDTGFIRCLHDNGIKVDTLVSTVGAAILKGNPYLRNIYEVDPLHPDDYLKKKEFPISDQLAEKLTQNAYDLVVDPATVIYPLHIFYLLYQISPKAVLGFNRWPSVRWYAKSFDFDIETTHVTKRWEMVADYLGLDKRRLEGYDVFIPEDTEQEAVAWLKKFEGRTVIINIFGSRPERCLTPVQLLDIINGLNQRYADINIILLDHKREIKIDLPGNVVINPFTTLHHAIALVKHVDMIISTDTAICHLASIWKKPLLAIYRNLAINNALWAPNYAEATQLIVGSSALEKQPDLAEKVLNAVPPFLG